jgi:hypothetical protein
MTKSPRSIVPGPSTLILRLCAGAFAGLLIAVLVACSAEPTSGRAEGFVCHHAYRPSVNEPISGEGTVSFPDFNTAEFAGSESDDLVFHAQYWNGEEDGERALRLWVTAAGFDEPLTSQLYQLPPDSGPTDQFAGGHGFTGLNYVYHPDSGAELQFWCAVAE